jgi:hypothetical protein
VKHVLVQAQSKTLLKPEFEASRPSCSLGIWLFRERGRLIPLDKPNVRILGVVRPFRGAISDRNVSGYQRFAKEVQTIDLAIPTGVTTLQAQPLHLALYRIWIGLPRVHAQRWV